MAQQTGPGGGAPTVYDAAVQTGQLIPLSSSGLSAGQLVAELNGVTLSPAEVQALQSYTLPGWCYQPNGLIYHCGDPIQGDLNGAVNAKVAELANQFGQQFSNLGTAANNAGQQAKKDVQNALPKVGQVVGVVVILGGLGLLVADLIE